MNDQAKIALSADERSDNTTLNLLEAVGADSRVSQRALAVDLNVALGLANAYLRRCVRRGWVKVHRVPPNRYAYFLTPKGLGEKTRLAARLLYNSFRLYRTARDQFDVLIEQAASDGQRRLALAGSGDLAEVALLCALRYDVEVVGVADSTARANRFRHVALAREVGSLPTADVILVTDMATPQATYDRLVEQYGAERVLCPRLLKVTPSALEDKP